MSDRIKRRLAELQGVPADDPPEAFLEVPVQEWTTLVRDEPVRPTVIAKRLGVSRFAVQNWRKRGVGFPKPINEERPPLFWWSEVVAWHEEWKRNRC